MTIWFHGSPSIARLLSSWLSHSLTIRHELGWWRVRCFSTVIQSRRIDAVNDSVRLPRVEGISKENAQFLGVASPIWEPHAPVRLAPHRMSRTRHTPAESNIGSAPSNPRPPSTGGGLDRTGSNAELFRSFRILDELYFPVIRFLDTHLFEEFDSTGIEVIMSSYDGKFEFWGGCPQFLDHIQYIGFFGGCCIHSRGFTDRGGNVVDQ